MPLALSLPEDLILAVPLPFHVRPFLVLALTKEISHPNRSSFSGGQQRKATRIRSRVDPARDTRPRTGRRFSKSSCAAFFGSTRSRPCRKVSAPVSGTGWPGRRIIHERNSRQPTRARTCSSVYGNAWTTGRRARRGGGRRMLVEGSDRPRSDESSL